MTLLTQWTFGSQLIMEMFSSDNIVIAIRIIYHVILCLFLHIFFRYRHGRENGRENNSFPFFLCTVNSSDDDSPQKKATDTAQGGYSFGAPKPGSGVKRTLKLLNTHFYVGTEDGEIVYVDWMPQKDQDSGKIQSKYNYTPHANQQSKRAGLSTALNLGINSCYLCVLFKVPFCNSQSRVLDVVTHI